MIWKKKNFAVKGCYVPLWRGKQADAFYTHAAGGGRPPPKTCVYVKFEIHPLQRGTIQPSSA